MKEMALFIAIVVALMFLFAQSQAPDQDKNHWQRYECSSQLTPGRLVIPLTDERTEPSCPGYQGKTK